MLTSAGSNAALCWGLLSQWVTDLQKEAKIWAHHGQDALVVLERDELEGWVQDKLDPHCWRNCCGSPQKAQQPFSFWICLKIQPLKCLMCRGLSLSLSARRKSLHYASRWHTQPGQLSHTVLFCEHLL